MFIFYLSRFLYAEIREANDLDTFLFFHPGLTFNLDGDFESYIVQRLGDYSDRICFIPHNSR